MAVVSSPRQPQFLAAARVSDKDSHLEWHAIDLQEAPYGGPIGDAFSSREAGYELLQVADLTAFKLCIITSQDSPGFDIRTMLLGHPFVETQVVSLLINGGRGSLPSQVARPVPWQVPYREGTIHQLRSECLQVQSSIDNAASKFEAVLLLNTQGKKRAPTVLVPHGGPHSVFPVSYLMSNLYFNILGYNVLQINYRSSRQSLDLHTMDSVGQRWLSCSLGHY